MILNKWIRNDLLNLNDFITWVTLGPKIHGVSFDTETTGLHIIKDVPFVYTLAFKRGDEYHAFYCDLREFTAKDRIRFIQFVYDMSRDNVLIGHNIIFDLHMSANIHKIIDHENVVDTQLLIRLGMDAVPVDRGGPPLQLKPFAKKYIDSNADVYEKDVSKWKTNKAKELNALLFDQFPKMKTKLIAFFKDFPNDYTDLPDPYYSAYVKWYKELPKRIRRNMTKPLVTSNDIPYNLIPAKILKIYAVFDAIYAYEIWERLLPVVYNRKNGPILEKECKLLIPTLRMTRVGFYINKPYVSEAKTVLKQYIIDQKKILHELAGQVVSVNQNKEILALIQTRFEHPDLKSTGESVLEELRNDIITDAPDAPLVKFINIILELRTLSKWYTTYLMRFYKTMQYSDRIYTSINLAGAVTGRVTSPFQQFPGSPIMRDGKEILNPRRMIAVAPDECCIMYFDYSQIELRLTGVYTILIGYPDLNLCRTYMPFNCYHGPSGIQFDPYDPDHILRWNEKVGEDSAWLRVEDNTPWKVSDLHAITAIEWLKRMGLPIPEKGTKEYKKARDIGKRTNFACNYGASKRKIHEMYPRMTTEEAYALHDSYGTSMPGIKKYHKYCYDLMNHDRVGTNLYGRHYYGMSGHNYANAAIQGTGADLLKEKMVEIAQWLKEQNFVSEMQMNIHDEISFIVRDWKEAPILYREIKRIMEDLPGSLVPIVAEVEATATTWADKTSKIGVDENGLFRIYNQNN